MDDLIPPRPVAPPQARRPLPARASDLALALGGELIGADERILSLASLQDAGPEQLAYFADRRYAAALRGCRAAALLVAEVEPRAPCPQIRVADPEGAFWGIAEAMAEPEPPMRGIDPRAEVHAAAQIDPAAWIGPLAVVAEGARVAAGAQIHPQAYVGPGASVGAGTVLHPGAQVLGGCRVGERCVLHPGAVVGAEGFGFRWDGQRHRRIPQLGTAILEDDVELGANSCVDRAALGATLIGRGARIDNLVQIGHGARIGPFAVICAQGGVAGSARVGEGSVLGGQVGIADHADVGAGVRVAARGAVSGRLEAGAVVAGVPAIPLTRWRRAMAALARLPDVLRRLRVLEEALAEVRGAPDPEVAGSVEGAAAGEDDGEGGPHR